MIILITGVPGAGKTLFAIQLIEKYLKEGRRVYSDIDELAMDVEPAPDDWRETPDGSVVVYDECQRRFGAQGMRGGRSENEIIAAMETHRHTGHDLILITQHPNLLHAHVRRLVGRHYHLHRRYGGTNVFSYDRCLKVDSKTDLQQAERMVWKLPKQYFGRYKSATVHTHKIEMPRTLKFLIAGSVVAVAVAVYALNTSRMFAFFNAEKEEAVPAAVEVYEVVTRVEWVDEEPEEPIEVEVAAEHDAGRYEGVIGGCVASERWCQCYDRALQPIFMEEHICRATALHPLARPPAIGARGTSAPAGGFEWSRGSNTGPNSQVRETSAFWPL